MGTISYPHTGMGIVAGIIFFRGYGYGIELPGGYIPVAIPIPSLEPTQTQPEEPQIRRGGGRDPAQAAGRGASAGHKLCDRGKEAGEQGRRS